MIFSGRFYDWNQKNIFALETMQNSLTKNNQRVLESFRKARSGGVVTRVFLFKKVRSVPADSIRGLWRLCLRFCAMQSSLIDLWLSMEID